MTTYLVTGASGQLGQLVVDSLKELVPAESIIALVRSDEAAASYKAKGIATRKGDYDDPKSLVAAFNGVDRLLLISSSQVGKRVAQHGNVVAAAKAAGVGFIAYTSLLNADTGGMKLAEEHIATETAIRASGIPHAFLRNGWYSENLTGTVASALQLGKHFGAAGEGRFATASRADYAGAAARVLASDGHDGKTYELGGDAPFTLAEYANLLSQASGETIEYVNLPEAAFKEAQVGAGLPEGFATILADSDARAASGALDTESHELSDLLGRPTTPIALSIAEALA